MRRLAMAALLGTAASLSAQTTVQVSNPTSDSWKDAPVVLPWKEGMPGSSAKLISARGTTETLPVQADDLNGDGKTDELVFLVNLAPGESKTYTLSGAAPPEEPVDRAHAGMYLKNEQIRGFEGPGWESDEIAFRLYWDERNATDVFCKQQPILSLEGYARKDVDYHRISKYGMDVLKVGKAVGIGGFGVWVDGKVRKVEKAQREHRVVVNGPIRSVTDLVYTDWQVDDRKYELRARMLTYGGQKWAEAQLELKAKDGKELPRLVTGIVRHEDTTLVKDPAAAYAGRWGKQALGEGEVPKSANLGLGVVLRPAEVEAIGEDEFNTHVVLKSKDGQARYRYNASWEKEPAGAQSAREYAEILARISRLEPVVKISGGEAR